MEANVALMEAFVPWANSQSWIERYFWNQAVSLVPRKLTVCVNLAQSAGSAERLFQEKSSRFSSSKLSVALLRCLGL